jgi:glyoxylase-like metal-dependent hydrolase (beta-lactamase superfamily II)
MQVEDLTRPEDSVTIRCLRNIGPYENNIFVVSDPASDEAYVIDAGYEPRKVAEAVQGLRVRSILVTHGHRDHHEHAEELRRLLGVPLGIGADDVAMLGIAPDFTIQDGQMLSFGAQALHAIHTPGHTPGSTCFQIDTHLFTGDTLFPGGPGNTQRDSQRFARIIDSIRERLFVLGDQTVVYPGHGRDTTIGQERPHLDEWIARGW